ALDILFLIVLLKRETENENKAPITEDLPEIIDIIILNPEVKIILEIEAIL
ncbi:10749_t:CDS:1, partial [Cetraspora pellucida]